MPSQAQRRRRDALIGTVAAILDTGEPTRFAFEGACRHAVRVSFILGARWPWRAADMAALEIVEAALRRLNVERPSWAEGQHAYTQTIVTKETVCRHCGVPLRARQVAFCSSPCRSRWWALFNEQAE